MKKISALAFCYLVFTTASAQNVGIGTNSPEARLHIKKDFEVLRLQGESPFISFYNNAGTYTGYLWNRNNTAMDLGTPAGSNLPVLLSPNTNPLASFNANGNVGINAPNPLFRLDVGGRMRLRHFGETSGIYFNNSANTFLPGFVGLFNDQHVGWWGSGSNWSLLMNTNTGNVGIGAMPSASSKLYVENIGGPALEVAGAIKVSGFAAPAFRLSVSAANQSDLTIAGEAMSVIIDHPSANGDPNALIFITPVQFLQGIPLYVRYDAGLGKWKMHAPVGGGLVLSGQTSPGAIRPCTPFGDCSVLTDVALVDRFFGFQVGNTFNVIIIKQ